MFTMKKLRPLSFILLENSPHIRQTREIVQGAYGEAGDGGQK